MKRLFWLGVGVAAGVWATRRTQAAAHSLTPAGIGANVADGLRELGAGLGAFGAEVRLGMAEREHELAALVERRTGDHLPTVSEALADNTSGPAPSPRARARRAGA